MDYQLLSWDTDFFGLKTGRIIPSSLSENQLSEILSSMKQEDFQFIYWPSSSRCEFDIDKHSGQFVDLKITFGIDLCKIDLKNYPLPETEAYKPSMPISQMENLAIQSGSYSSHP